MEDWKKEIERLENLIKERETSRFRATTTLIEDSIKSFKGDKRIPISSIKGFIFSLLYPRAVIILGSILGTLFVAIQTYVLISQNKMIERQNVLLAFEQTSSLRSLMQQTPYDSLGQPLLDFEGNPNKIMNWPVPNNSIVEQLVKFGEEEPVATVNSLTPLLKDKNSSVSSSALLILKELNFQYGLGETNFSGSNFNKSILNDAVLQNCQFSYCDFQKAKLMDCFFNESIFDNSNMSGADFKGSEIGKTSFLLTDLSFCNFEDVQIFNDIRTMAGANIYEIKNAQENFSNRAYQLGAVNMNPSEWITFNDELQDLYSYVIDGMKEVDFLKKYINERNGFDFESWQNWKKAHNNGNRCTSPQSAKK